MKELLFDVLFMSDIRKDLLLLLNEGPRDLDTIMDIMHIEKQPLALQIKILEDQYLVKRQTDSPGSYALTTIGDLLVKEMKPLMGILDFLDSNNGYWEDHRLDFIPHRLLERIEELGPFTISEPRLSEIYDFDSTLQEKSRVSDSLYMVTTYLHPMFISLFLELLDQGVDVSVVLSRGLFAKIQSEQHDKLKRLIQNEHTDLYIYPEEMHFLSFSENDYYVQFMLLTNENYYDNKRFISGSQSALKWGREFFDYYRNSSTKVMDI